MEKVCIDRRAVELARYIITTKDTVRGAAKKFGVSKSTVQMELLSYILISNKEELPLLVFLENVC